ncbi:TniQ family protein [Leptolyngbya sp. FACHB-671]|uniref:TnsD family Tn7-like transposition protein n=1 Tax=Leptolyngbya sp. FACHB-671 TaxID=2692812 RepID=UPI0016889FEC|nr:TnsD family Tn7-like transposition protein [Leptolyngbya sp. FACHB-671]MBD2069543.1 TniQ family protein [Leptolyngbya sp. FACHB-671]
MLRTFPTPYPDELLYSIFARHHIRSGNKSFQQTVEELLGYVPQQLYGLGLPNSLSVLAKNLHPITNLTVEGLVVEHTLFPFYKSFLTPPEAFRLKDLMKKKAGKPIFQVAKIAVIEKDSDKQLLRFCSQCFEEDFQKYGEAYWHRTHQIPGVLVCLEHKKLLNDSLVPLQDGYLDCYAANLENCLVSDVPAICQESTLQQLIAIAKEISWLCSAQFEFKGLQWLRKQYQHHLVAQSFVSFSSSRAFKFHEEKFVDAVLSCYGQDCLSLIKPGLADRLGRYFYRCLFACDVEPVIDRVTHVLLIKFLLNSLKNLLEA